jgi:hypothetical protein
LAGLKNHAPVPNFVPDRVVIKEISMLGVLSSSWTAVERSLSLLEQLAPKLACLCTHAYKIDQAETALRVLGREIQDGPEAVHVHIDCR